MRVQRDSFFRIFSSELRGALQYFFENRRGRITPEVARDFVDVATLERLVALGLIEFDGDSREYRLDERTEGYLNEMLGVTEAAQAGRKSSLARISSGINRVRILDRERNRNSLNRSALAVTSMAEGSSASTAPAMPTRTRLAALEHCLLVSPAVQAPCLPPCSHANHFPRSS